MFFSKSNEVTSQSVKNKVFEHSQFSLSTDVESFNWLLYNRIAKFHRKRSDRFSLNSERILRGRQALIPMKSISYPLMHENHANISNMRTKLLFYL